MSQPQTKLYAIVLDGVVKFPAFVRLPPSARPESSFLFDSKVEPVKCITLCTGPNESHSRSQYKQQIAARWAISEDVIRALVVNLDGQRVLIEDSADWYNWVNAYFFRPTSASSSDASSIPTSRSMLKREEFVIKPVHIDIIVATEETRSSSQEEAVPSSNQADNCPDPAEELPSRATNSASDHAASSLPRQQDLSDPIAGLVNNIVAPVFQSLQPQIRDLVDTIAGSILTLSAQVAFAHNQYNASPTHTSRFTSADQPSDSHLTTPGLPEINIPAALFSEPFSSTEEVLPRQAEADTHRQSLMSGLMDELDGLRAQRASSSVAQPSAPGTTTGSTDGEGMPNELSEAFAEMLARQRSTAPAESRDEDDGSLTFISTPSTTSRRSSRSRSPSRRTFLTTTILTLLTLLTFILTLVSPTTASALNPHPLTQRANPYGAPIQNSRHLHLCKCTCFQTNSTLVPLYSPADPSKPCLTCTRQFCLDQGLEVCKGAKLEHADHDVGTGFEGDVWAKCFERDSYKDQGIITLYILVIVGLVAFAGLRGRFEDWYSSYRGPRPSWASLSR